MAATEGLNRRVASKLIAWLAVPRAVTFLLLVALGSGLGEAAWLFINKDPIFAWLSGLAAPFCMICAAAVWAMRDRIDDVIDTDGLSSAEYQSFARLVASHRARATFWAAVAAALALLSSGPAVSSQLVGAIPRWMVLGCGGAVGGAIGCYLLASHWEAQIRGYKNQQKLLDKRRREKQALIDEINAAAGTLSEHGWVQGPTLNSTRHPK